MKAPLLAAGLASATAIAASAPPAEDAAKIGESSQVVCVKSTEIGSRLRQRQICRTRAEWDEYRQSVRTKVARIQATGEAPGN